MNEIMQKRVNLPDWDQEEMTMNQLKKRQTGPVRAAGSLVRASFLFGLALLGSAAIAIGADSFAIDPVHSGIEFSVRHLLISQVKGKFLEFSGTILYDDEDLSRSRVEITIQVKSIDTGNEGRDGHLRGAEFFDVENHPEITFQSEEIRKRGEKYIAVGNLTIRGVSRRIELPFEVLGKVNDPWGNVRIGVRAEITIDRQDFGVSWSKTLDNGGLVVGNEVKIELNLEAMHPIEKPEEKQS